MTATHRSAVRTVLSLLAAAAVLTACGAAAVQPTPTPKPVTVRFAHRTNAANYVALAYAFSAKYPHITIQLVSSSSMQTQGQAIGAGYSLTLLKMQSIDVFRDTIPDIAGAQLKSELLPLDEYITAQKSFPRADFLPGLLDTLKIEGTQVGIPAGVNPIVAYYDSRRLIQANAKAPDANWTLDDFLNIAVATNNQTTAGPNDPNYVVGFCSDPRGIDPVVITYLMGGQLVDSLQGPTRATMNSEANVRAVQWYAGLRTSHKVIPEPAESDQAYYRNVYDTIRRGRCGVWLGFYSDMRGAGWGTAWLGDPVMMPLPRGQSSFNVASVDGYFMLRGAAHPQEAWLWLMFLLEHEQAAGTQIPPRTSQIDSEAFAGRVTPDVAAVARSLPKTTTVVRVSTVQSFGGVFNTYLEAVAKVVRGESDAKTALTAAQDKAQLLLAK